MSMSDNQKYQRQVVIHLSVAIFCALFGGIYEYFSHQVYSYFMIYAFAIPLVCGAFLYAILSFLSTREPNMRAMWFWNSAIAAFTIGCLFKGVLDIYGTTNKLLIVYPVVGVIMTIMALVSLVRAGKK